MSAWQDSLPAWSRKKWWMYFFLTRQALYLWRNIEARLWIIAAVEKQ
jgi:hypothetical protein